MSGVALQIGPVRLASNLLLAPIAGYCDLAFRLVCRSEGGVGLACTDLLSPQGLLRGTATSLDLARTTDEDQPLGMQLYGSDPKIMAEGARWAADNGATVVDINMGCPVDKVTKRDGGSKLMCDPARAARITGAVRSALAPEVPVTVKMRLGWSEADCEAGLAGDLARLVIDAGAAAITVHGRTTEQRFRGDCRLEDIRRAVESIRQHCESVPVIGNGDVREPEDAVRMLRATGCDGIMIGRGALSAPWLFRQICEALAGRPAPEPTDNQKLRLIRRYFDLMREFRDDRYAVQQINRRISWFAKRLNHGHCRPLKDAIRQAQTPSDVYRALDRWERRSPAPRAHRAPSRRPAASISLTEAFA